VRNLLVKLALLVALAGSTAVNFSLESINRRLVQAAAELERSDAELKQADDELRNADAQLKDSCDKLAHNAQVAIEVNKHLCKAGY
jgi:ATP-dependent protease HslVU (ClpYQ) peptidase subunit